MFQNYFWILELQKSFTTYKWVIMHMVHIKRSYTVKYNKTKGCEILIFGDDLKFWSFFKIETLNL
jgi:hypothetical protein